MNENASIDVALPSTGFKRSMFFNRIAIERVDAFVHIHFGFVNAANLLVTSYSTVITELEVAALRKTSMDYLGRLGPMLEEPPPWQPANVCEVELSNHIAMARHGPIAETLLYHYSHWAALQETKKRLAEKAKSAQKPSTEKAAPQEPSSGKVTLGIGLTAEAVAMLRSPLATQQHLIRLLFTRDQPELDVK